MSRPSIDQYFMNVAKVVATRSTCLRKQVGSVIVRDKRILSTGYNGSIPGAPHCTEVGCLIENDHCVRTIHSETSAILWAAKAGINLDNSTIYVTASPCWDCTKALISTGIKCIYYAEWYRDQRSLEVAKELGIQMILMSEES